MPDQDFPVRRDDCIGCAVESGIAKAPGGAIFATDRWTVNHRLPDEDGEWTGWFVAQPRRHVLSFADLDALERRELGQVLAWVDGCLREVEGASRVYVASLGASADAHLHLHLVPQFGDELGGIDALCGAPVTGSRDRLIDRLRESASVTRYPLGGTSYRGIAKVVKSATDFFRHWSPYTIAKRIQRKRMARRGTGQLSSVAEVYGVGSLLLMLVGLVVAWGLRDPVGTIVAVVFSLLGAGLLVDILATVTGIILFEAQSKDFAGVTSLPRTVILAIVNVAQAVVVFAVGHTAVALAASEDAYSPHLDSVVDALGKALSPLGSSGADPVSAVAKWMDVGNAAILMYLTLLVLAVFVGELVGGLRRD